MKQLTEWLKGEKRFFTETFRRLSKVTKPELRDYEGEDIHIQGAAAIFVPSKYMTKCKKYVQNNCNIITGAEMKKLTSEEKALKIIADLFKKHSNKEITRDELFNTLHKIIPRDKKKRFVELDQEKGA